MILMSTFIVVRGSCCCFIRFDRRRGHLWRRTSSRMLALAPERRIFLRLAPRAKRGGTRRKRTWWKNFFSDEDDGDWSDDVLFDGTTDDASDRGVHREETSEEEEDDDRKFEAWKRRAEAISELREAQEDARNAEGREWEDWLGDVSSSDPDGSTREQQWGGRVETSREASDGPDVTARGKDLVGAIKDLVLGNEDDELLFEDRVFRYASSSSAKFVALLVIVPWALDFLVHDFVLMPFLDRYVKTVPLAAEILDVRRHQKLEMIKTLKVERARFRLEVEIGKSPPLSDEELWLELRHRAIELRDELRLENRSAFANIFSDMVYGIASFLLIYLNNAKVALLKFTGYKLLNNISDTGKAFLIILITDIFLGYHSESGWQALVETILERYGLEVDQAAITVFICVVPVIVDACVKLWLFKYLPKLSPNVTNIFQEMKRH